MILLLLMAEFCFIGLFAIGGGMATVPFLMSLAERRGWFTLDQLSNIIAISEATPGPIGINMATYVGYTVAGVPGAILASLALVLPAFLVILLLSKLIGRWRKHPTFQAVFYGLRPASVGLIAAVLLSFAAGTFFTVGDVLLIHWKSIVLFAVLLACFFIPKVKKLPIPVFLLAAALCGVVFQMGGA